MVEAVESHPQDRKKKKNPLCDKRDSNALGEAYSYDGLSTNIRNKIMHIQIRNKKDIALIKRLAIQHAWSYTKVVSESVKSASQEYLLRGRIATLEFMLRICKEESDEKKKK